MKPLEVWTCQRAENLNKKSWKIHKNNYAATMVSAARRQIIGGGSAPINKNRRRGPQIVGGAAPRGRSGMKMCPAWSAVRKTSNINIDGPAAPTFVARTNYHTTYVYMRYCLDEIMSGLF